MLAAGRPSVAQKILRCRLLAFRAFTDPALRIEPLDFLVIRRGMEAEAAPLCLGGARCAIPFTRVIVSMHFASVRAKV